MLTQWIANLPMRRKFWLMSLVALVMSGVPAAILLSKSFATVQDLKSERMGMPPSRQLMALIKHVQLHRGVSTGFLSGDAGKRNNMREVAAKASAAFEDTRKVVASLGNAGTDQSLNKLQNAWQDLVKDTSNGIVTPAANVQRHTELISALLLALEDVTAASKLALDADAESYFIIQASFGALPRLSETLGQMRVRGNAVLVKRSTTPEQTLKLAGLSDLAKSQSQDAQRNLARAFASASDEDPKLIQAAKDAAEAVAKGVAMVSDLTQSDVLPETPPAQYFQAMTDVMAAQFALTDLSLARLETLFDQRLSVEYGYIAFNIGAILAMLALGGWIAASVTRSTIGGIAQAVSAAQALADGDFSRPPRSTYTDEIGQMVNAMGDAIVQLQKTISGIKSASDSVATASTQIAQGNMDLSARTENQASSLEETASSMEEMSATVKNNTSTAMQASHIANEASREATQGGEVFAKVVAKMGEIKQTSTKIADINAVIDGIAFQTNILALNAAVEAARAGEQGRGFAVVAAEVRSLAQRSASAAREIKTLIGSSVERVDEGYELATTSTDGIERLIGQVQKVSQLMSEISLASEQQSMGIAQVNQAVTQLDQTTQQNAALVEESSAAAASLSDQASRLQQAVSGFRLA